MPKLLKLGRFIGGNGVYRRISAFLLAAAAMCPAPASAAWREAKTKHFIIYSEQSPKDLRQFAQELEQFDRGARLLGGMEDPPLTDSGKLTIYVVPSRADIVDLYTGGKTRSNSGVAGFYIPRASGPVAFVHSESKGYDPEALTAKSVFFHEYHHHLLLQSLDAAMPLWATEGSAEFYATAKPSKDGALVFGAPPQHRAYGLFQMDALTIEEMVGATNPKMTVAEHEQVYGRGWLLVHMLIFDKSRQGQYSAYGANIQRGMSALDAAKSAFGDLKVLDRDLRRYLSKGQFAGFSVPKVAFSASDVAIRELSAAEDAIMPTTIRSGRGVGEKLAPKVLEGARKVAARFPNDPAVLAALAEAEQDAGNNKEAIAAADRALAASPSSGKAMVMKARALLAMSEQEPAKTDWTALRALIGKANKLDPDAAEPLMLFYKTYAAQGIAPTRNAMEGLIYAQQLVPQDDTLRLLTVRALIGHKKLAEAERLFGPLAYDPHVSSEQREKRLKIMAALKTGNVKDATAILDEPEDPKKDGKKS